MIFGRLRVIQRDQRGLTLLELLIAIVLAGAITSGITMTIFQVFDTSSRTSNHMIAIRQVQHAGKQVSEDLLQAQDVVPDESPGFPLTLTWTDWGETGGEHEVIYTLEDNKLWRSESVNDGEPTVTRVAEYIDPDQTCCGCGCGEDCGCDCGGDCGCLTFKVTANVGGQSETREYEVTPRASSQ